MDQSVSQDFKYLLFTMFHTRPTSLNLDVFCCCGSFSVYNFLDVTGRLYKETNYDEEVSALDQA